MTASTTSMTLGSMVCSAYLIVRKDVFPVLVRCRANQHVADSTATDPKIMHTVHTHRGRSFRAPCDSSICSPSNSSSCSPYPTHQHPSQSMNKQATRLQGYSTHTSLPIAESLSSSCQTIKVIPLFTTDDFAGPLTTLLGDTTHIWG